MFLRRITQYVKTQNWFAIFLDFIIVVFGVFIGIQIANWNDFNKEQLLEFEIFDSIQRFAFFAPF